MDRRNLLSIALLATWAGVGPAVATSTVSAPSNLSAAGVSSSQIDLTWVDNSNNEREFKIERASSSAGPWTQIAATGSNVTSYSNTGLSPSTTWYYRVRANKWYV